MTTKKRERCKNALQRLKTQLKRGVKPSKDGNVELSKRDKIRILNEIKTLETKIKF